MTRTALALSLAAGAALGASATAAHAQAVMTLTITESAGNLVASASGTLNLAGLSVFGSGGDAGSGSLYNRGFRAGVNGPYTSYTGFSGPTAFGGPGGAYVSSGTGPLFQFEVWNGRLYLAQGYVSGTPLFSTSTVNNATYASVNLAPGTYTWTYGSGETAGIINLSIPAPGAAAALGMAGLAATRRRRR